MAWFNEAIFYHIYPLGLLGAPKTNDYQTPVSRIRDLFPVIKHIKDIGCNAIYIGPLFESVGHGYETTDYTKADSRLGNNEDLKEFVNICHSEGIKVIFDGVFNHTGRDFFAFQDILKNRENSNYKNWYKINFYGNNSYNDGFSYENWGGYDLLVKLNQQNTEVIGYFCDIIRLWVREFDIDGIRLDAADVLDFGFMENLRRTANEVKDDFFLLGEVIHGDYNRWVNNRTLHSVTNYVLHKALYSGHNDHNYFEIAHTVKRLRDMGIKNELYNFCDNHDVERICTRLTDKSHFIPVHILLYTLPGIPSVYYGSEFGIEGRKERHSDDSLRPFIPVERFTQNKAANPFTEIISALGKIRQQSKALAYGDYKELCLTNRQYAFMRNFHSETVIVTVNNSPENCSISFSANANGTLKGALSGKEITPRDGSFTVNLDGNSGEIWINSNFSTEFTPVSDKFLIKENNDTKPEKTAHSESNAKQKESSAEPVPHEKQKESFVSVTAEIPNKPYEEMTVSELQAVILMKMAKNGPVTDRMKQDVYENVYHSSLVTWAKSFI